jgi:hypothetical protein
MAQWCLELKACTSVLDGVTTTAQVFGMLPGDNIYYIKHMSSFSEILKKRISGSQKLTK